MKVVQRSEITEDTYLEILEKETHHNHTIILDDSDVLRWKENPDTRRIRDRMDLNDIVVLFNSLGYDANSEPLRKLYRNMGYSLFGYWEVFYWEANNRIASEYKVNIIGIGKGDSTF